jgi:hypothetical protein
MLLTGHEIFLLAYFAQVIPLFQFVFKYLRAFRIFAFRIDYAVCPAFVASHIRNFDACS